MERCGLDGAERDAAFAALGDADDVREDAFVSVVTAHVDLRAAPGGAPGAPQSSPSPRSPRRRDLDPDDKPRRSKSRSYIDGLLG